MKQVLFILLVFISFQGFSQMKIKSVKLKKINLEVMKTDLGKMTWVDANKACEKLGEGWRLPTIDELKKIYSLKDKIGGFNNDYYWSITETEFTLALYFNFFNGTEKDSKEDSTGYVRAVRTLK
jgi:hypothetical protein